jgi:hypothetical protein
MKNSAGLMKIPPLIHQSGDRNFFHVGLSLWFSCTTIRMKAARISIVAIAICISMKETALSLVHDSQRSLTNDDQNDSNIALFDSMQKEFGYLYNFSC